MRFLGLRDWPMGFQTPTRSGRLREALKKADVPLMACFGALTSALRSEGFLAMSGQIVDATIVATPKTAQHDRRGRRRIKEGHILAGFPGRTSLRSSRRKTGMRAGRSNTPRRSRARMGVCSAVDLAIPAFGYKNHNLRSIGASA